MPALRPFGLLAKIPYFVPAQLLRRSVRHPPRDQRCSRSQDRTARGASGRSEFILDVATVEWKTPYGHSTCRRIDDPMDAWKKAGTSGLLVLVTDRAPQKSIPPIPPMPPPAPPGMAEPCFFGSSATIASVVISSPATEAAPCRATRTTFVGSMMPFETKLPYSPVCAS